MTDKYFLHSGDFRPEEFENTIYKSLSYPSEDTADKEYSPSANLVDCYEYAGKTSVATKKILSIIRIAILLSIIRLAILLSIGIAATLLFFCEEQNDVTSAFLLQVLFDKLLAAALFCAAAMLYKRWSITDPLLSDIGSDEEDADNSMRL